MNIKSYILLKVESWLDNTTIIYFGYVKILGIVGGDSGIKDALPAQDVVRNLFPG